MSDQPTLEHLSDFLSSPGWEWFSAYVTKEWGPSGLRYQQAVREASKEANAVLELQKVLYAQEAIYALMKHPANVHQAKRAKGLAEVAGMVGSRRGPGL